MKRLIALLALATALIGLPGTAGAANGDNLRTIIADRTGTACASINAAGDHLSVGVGIAFDGTNLLISCFSDNTVTAINPADGSQVGIHNIVGASSLGALAWDNGRGLLWACSAFNTVGTIDMTTNVYTPTFVIAGSGVLAPGCFDGLAYDGSDDTIWASGDVSPSVEHFTVTGTQLSSNPVSLGGCNGGFPSSGIAVGGPLLYLANNGCSEIYEVPKDFSSETLFASFPRRLEDMECDNVTFPGAIWSIDAFDNVLNAWEIPAGTCTFGGGEPELELTLDPPTATNEVGTSHDVTAHLTADGEPVEDASILFDVSGANSASGSDDTDAAGDAEFSYSGSNTGTDTIVACYDADASGTCDDGELTAEAEKEWVDTTAPTASCAETNNPSGDNVPNSGPNAGNSGQNPDGFYVVEFGDNVEVGSAVLKDTGSDFVVVVANGEKFKLVQAPGATPNWKPGAGDIDKKITFKGDATLVVTDASGNVTETSCLVPPPPK